MATRHKEYYFKDGDVVFLVADTLFRVHERVLTRDEPSAFSDMFSLPGSAGMVEGQNDERPIALTGDSVEEFESLLRLLYPPFLDEPLNIPIRTYRMAMKIANKYSMEDVQAGIALKVSKQINSDTYPSHPLPISLSLERLCLLFEFPNRFRRDTARLALGQVNCATVTPVDLAPFQNELVLMSVLLRNAATRGGNSAYLLDGIGFLN